MKLVEKRSLIANVIWNVIYRIVAVAVPLVFSMYSSRIFSADGVGQIAFAQNIMTYFTTIAILGIPNYGTKKIGALQSNREERNKVFSELFIINAISSLACCVAFYTMLLSVSTLRNNWLMWIFGLQIVFNILNFDWVYQGSEDYKYVAICSTITKLLSVGFLFVFVTGAENIAVYVAILCFSNVGYYILNFVKLHKYVSFSFSGLKLTRHLKTIFILLASSCATELYTLLDTTMVGAMCTKADLGYYTNAVKVVRTVFALISAPCAVYLPRLSECYNNEKKEEYNRLACQGLKLALFLSIPCFFGVLLVSDSAIPLLFGGGFEPAVVTLNILAVLIPVFSIAFICGHMILMATNNEKRIMQAAIIGALVNIVLNFLLIWLIGYNGAAVASVISEIVVTVVLIYYAYRNVKYKFPIKYLVVCLVAAVVFYGVGWIIRVFVHRLMLRFVITVPISVIIYFVITLLLRNDTAIAIASKLLSIFKRKKVEADMKYEKTSLDGVIVVNPDVHGDNRGWFMETFREDELKAQGIISPFVQDNQSFSAQKGTIRGIHYQNYPYAQSKLVRCLKGEILDVAVDLRLWSPTYKKWVAVKLSAENRKQLYIPRGFGHGFVTLSDDVEIAYKCDDYYNKASEGGIRFDDSELAIDWTVDAPILSEKDKTAPMLAEAKLNFDVRVLVTGVNGQLGYDVVKLLKSKGIECIGVDIYDFDITDKLSVNHFLGVYKPTVIVHCAAYTAVDRAEDDKEICTRINVLGTKNIAEYCIANDVKFVHISTDYVYGDNGKSSLKESDATVPLGVYGQTKLDAEKEAEKVKKHFILRTSGVFGKHGNNFVKTMLRLAESKTELTVVDDQYGAPTYTVDLANIIVQILFMDKYGTYNVNNEGECTWCDFAKEIFKRTGKKVKVISTTTVKYGSKAKRQLNSRLDKSKLYAIGIEKLPTWQDALERYLEEIL